MTSKCNGLLVPLVRWTSVTAYQQNQHSHCLSVSQNCVENFATGSPLHIGGYHNWIYLIMLYKSPMDVSALSSQSMRLGTL